MDQEATARLGHRALTTRFLVFTRAPIPGEVKTRLIPALGAEGAAALHRQLTEQQIERLCAEPLGAVELWGTPDTSHPFFAEQARRWSISLHRQFGRDLGERLQRAAEQALGRADAVVLVGSDCPDLDAAYARAALERLQTRDAVIGPAIDGGYVLLGLRRSDPALFTDMPWGTAEVAARTRRRLDQLGWAWSELSPLQDVDRPEDLARLDPSILQALTRS